MPNHDSLRILRLFLQQSWPNARRTGRNDDIMRKELVSLVKQPDFERLVIRCIFLNIICNRQRSL